MRELKLFILSNLLCSFLSNTFGQSIAQKWQTTGNYGVGQSAYIGTADTTHLSFGVNGSEKMRLNNAGNLGIGNRNPQRRLVSTISSNSSITNIAMENVDTTNGNSSILSYRSSTKGAGRTSFVEFAAINGFALEHINSISSGAMAFYLRRRNGTLLYETMRLDSSLNVGIGTKNPTQKLQVHGLVYSDSGGYKFPDGSIQATAAGANKFWSLTGNSGTNISTTNFIGTTDASDFFIKTNNLLGVKVFQEGSTPSVTIGDVDVLGNGSTITVSDVNALITMDGADVLINKNLSVHQIATVGAIASSIVIQNDADYTFDYNSSDKYSCLIFNVPLSAKRTVRLPQESLIPNGLEITIKSYNAVNGDNHIIVTSFDGFKNIDGDGTYDVSGAYGSAIFKWSSTLDAWSIIAVK